MFHSLKLRWRISVALFSFAVIPVGVSLFFAADLVQNRIEIDQRSGRDPDSGSPEMIDPFLTRRKVSQWWLTEEEVQRLAESPHLETLELEGSYVPVGFIEELSNSPRLKFLRLKDIRIARVLTPQEQATKPVDPFARWKDPRGWRPSEHEKRRLAQEGITLAVH